MDIIPAKVQVIRTIRKKSACKNCEDTVKTSLAPAILLPKSIASAGTMAYIITSKYADGLLLYRLSGILTRYGIDMPRQTLSESILRVVDLLQPLMDYLNEQLMQSTVLHMDETPAQVLNEPGKTPQGRSYMWVQRSGLSDKPVIRFHYDPGRSTQAAEQLLAGFQGVLMTDGYTAYRKILATHGQTHLCCWAHARRKFVEAQKVQSKGNIGKADMALSLIAKLYAVEKAIVNSDAATRHRKRQDVSRATLDKLHNWLIKTQDGIVNRVR